MWTSRRRHLISISLLVRSLKVFDRKGFENMSSSSRGRSCGIMRVGVSWLRPEDKTLRFIRTSGNVRNLGATKPLSGPLWTFTL